MEKKKNDLIIAMSKNSTLAQNVLVYWVDQQIGVSRNLPARDYYGQYLPSSSDVETSSLNHIYNLVAYDEFYGKKLKSDDAIKCLSGDLTWRCIFSKDIQIANNKLVLFTTRQLKDGTVEKIKAYDFELPTPKFIEERRIRLRKEAYELIKKREDLLAWAETMQTGKIIPDDSYLWAVPKGQFVN